jgi:micrococcal nuclease
MRRGMWGACAYETESFYVGNPRTQVFHRPKCPLGQKVPRYRRVKWGDRWQALEQGYRPCRRCKP